MDDEALAAGIWSAQFTINLITALVSNGILEAEVLASVIDDTRLHLSTTRPQQAVRFEVLAKQCDDSVSKADVAWRRIQPRGA